MLKILPQAHVIVPIGVSPTNVFNLEVLFKSFLAFSRLDFHMTVFVNAEKFTPVLEHPCINYILYIGDWRKELYRRYTIKNLRKVVILMDADTMVLGDLGNFVEYVAKVDGIHALHTGKEFAESWKELLEVVGIDPDYWDENHYFNNGVIFLGSDSWNRLRENSLTVGKEVYDLIYTLLKERGTRYFSPQIAQSLFFQRLQEPRHVLPWKYHGFWRCSNCHIIHLNQGRHPKSWNQELGFDNDYVAAAWNYLRTHEKTLL